MLSWFAVALVAGLITASRTPPLDNETCSLMQEMERSVGAHHMLLEKPEKKEKKDKKEKKYDKENNDVQQNDGKEKMGVRSEKKEKKEKEIREKEERTGKTDVKEKDKTDAKKGKKDRKEKKKQPVEDYAPPEPNAADEREEGAVTEPNLAVDRAMVEFVHPLANADQDGLDPEYRVTHFEEFLDEAEKMSKTDPFLPNNEEDSEARPFKIVRGADKMYYMYVKYLGRGGFGRVWSALGPEVDLINFPAEIGGKLREGLEKEHRSMLEPHKSVDCSSLNPRVAIKVAKMSKGEWSRRGQLTNIWNEVVILKQVKGYPFMCEIYDAFQDKRQIYYIPMALLPGGSLFKNLVGSSQIFYTMEQAMYFFRELLLAVVVLHDVFKRAHHDLKPDNIMLTRPSLTSSPILIDFGMAVPIDKLCKNYGGTPGYRPWEVINKKPHNPGAMDVWSLGVILYNLLTSANMMPLKMPFDQESKKVPLPNLQWSTKNEAYLNKIGAPKVAIEICKGMLNKDVTRRFKKEDVLKKLPPDKGSVQSPDKKGPDGEPGQDGILARIRAAMAANWRS